MSPIDLYVGAMLPLLGRNITLMQASKATCRWLDVYAQQLGRLRAQMKAVCVPLLVLARLMAADMQISDGDGLV